MTIYEALAYGKRVFPSLRFGQLIDNARCWFNEFKDTNYQDIYHIPDETLARMIQEYVTHFSEGGPM